MRAASPWQLGGAAIDEFDGVLDDFLDEQRGKFVNVHQLMESGSSRLHARLPPTPADAPTGVTEEELEKLRRSKLDAQGNTLRGEESSLDALEASDGESDGSIEEHPFFDGLKEKPKEKKWDAETILSTYTMTDHHPTMIHVPRRVKGVKGGAQGSGAGGAQPIIALDKKTGLPVGTMLPVEEERARQAAAARAWRRTSSRHSIWGRRVQRARAWRRNGSGSSSLKSSYASA